MTDWASRLTIFPDGYVTIGTTPNHLARLGVVGGTNSNPSTFFGIQDLQGHAAWMYLSDNNAKLTFMNSAGTWGALTIAGEWVNGSDRVLKKEIGNIQYGLAEILKLKPRRYRMKFNNEAQIGFIGQEVREVIPEVVSGEEGHITLAYGPIGAVIVKAVQELKAENDELRERNDRLEARMKVLEGK